MTKQDLEQHIAQLAQQEAQHRILAERAAGAKQMAEHVLARDFPAGEPAKDPAPVREFPHAVDPAAV